MKTLFQTLLLTLAFLVLAEPAHAYLDPGTGSVILQAVLAGVAGAAIVFRMYMGKFKDLFRRAKTAPDADEPLRDDPTTRDA